MTLSTGGEIFLVVSAVKVSSVTECYSPSTGELIGKSKLDSVETVSKSIQKARKAQEEWAALHVRERVRYIKKVRDYIAENASDIAETISKDNGKVRVDALATEVLSAAMGMDYYMKNASRFLRDRKIPSGNIMMINKRSSLGRIPFGVIGIISPWNYPFAIPFTEVVMALLAGNSVILKVATETQLVGRKIEECFSAAGLPAGIFKHVNIPGSQAGTAFLEGGVDKLFFTGSVSVGKWLMAKASETLTPVVLELGGNDAMLVCEDAYIDRAVYGAVWAGLSNSGQSCAGVERIYVHESVYDTFIEKICAVVNSLRVGEDRDFNVDLGAMTTKKQMETVEIHVRDALNKGAIIAAESSIPSGSIGNFIPARILVNVSHDMLLMKEETFGPVIGVMKVRDMDEAVKLANDSNLGLTGSVWSKNRRNAVKTARRIRAGAVMINDHLMSHGLAETPWGGFRESGIGRTHGSIGFDEMTEAQVIVKDSMSFMKKNLWWHPYSEKVYHGLLGIINLLYGKGAGKKMSGFGKLLKIIPRYFEKD